MKKFTTLSIFLFAACFLKAQDGTLDATFGNAGWATGQYLNAFSDATCIAVQTDGKIVIAGTTAIGGTTVVAMRFSAAGVLDATFGTGGIAAHNLGTQSIITCLALTSDGKIVLGGDDSQKPMLVRLNSNGSLDTSFDGDGYITFDDKLSKIVDIKILAGNKILGCAGAIDASSNSIFALFRRNSNGSADTGFGTGGFAKFDFGEQELINRIALYPDGRIIGTGVAYKATTKYDLLIARFSANGVLDNTFGTGGIVTKFFTSGNPYEQGNDVALQNDGKIIIGGRNSVNGANAFLVARFNADGTSDTGFGTSGRTFTTIGTNDEARCIAALKDGKILVAGYTTIAGNRNYALARYTSAGVLDNTFGTAGITKVASGLKSSCEEFTILPSGKILAVGYAEPTALNRFFAVARFNHSQTTDTENIEPETISAKIFPNPASGGQVNLQFNLEEKSNCSARLLDVDGKVLTEFFNENLPVGQQNGLFNLPESMSSGMYFIQILTEKGAATLPLEILK